MAENNDAMFTMDVGDVLARLHISAILKLKQVPIFKNNDVTSIFNTGVVGMVDNPVLDAVKNNGVQFDLTSPNGLYEVGVVVREFNATSAKTYVDNFIEAQKLARKALFSYFAAFAGEFKAKNVEKSELYGFLIRENLKPWNIDTYSEYKYKIPIEQELPSTFQNNINWKERLCFKVMYEIDSDTM